MLPKPAQQSAPDGTAPVVVVSLVTALCLLGDSMLYVALPIYWREAGLVSLGEVGVLLSINRMVRLPLYPLVDRFYSRVQLRIGLIIAVALAVISTTGYGLWQGLWAWLLLRSIWGLAWSLLRLGGFFTVVNYAGEDNRGRLMGTYNGLYRLGSLLGMLAGGFLTGMIGFRMVALIFGIISSVGIPLIYFFVAANTPQASNHKQATTATRAQWLSPPALRVIASGLLISMLIRGVLNSTLSLVIEHNFGISITLFSISIGAAALAGLIQAARWTWEPFLAVKFGHWSDGPRGRLPLLISFLLLSALGSLLLPLSLPLFLWLLIIFSVLISATALTTLVDSLASDVAKSTAALTILTGYQIAADAGSAIGPLLGYRLIELDNGFFYTYLCCALIYLLIAFLWYKPLLLHIRKLTKMAGEKIR
jgi:MFS family permease